MNQSLSSALLAAQRDEITTGWYENVPTNERTFGMRLLAGLFVDEYLRALQAGRAPDFVDLAERICARPGRATALASLLDASEALHAYLNARALPDRYLKELRLLGSSVLAQAEAERESSNHPFNERMEEIDATINRLIEKLALVNKSSADHAREVSAWCGRLARRLGFSERETIFVKRAGLLHDIGDLETDPAPADRFEHVAAGERIVQRYSSLAPFAEVVRSHHEALDGSGYPGRLSGDQLSLAIRVVSVADAFNDLVRGDRTRAPLTARNAVTTLATMCGSLYDVAVVGALQDLIARR